MEGGLAGSPVSAGPTSFVQGLRGRGAGGVDQEGAQLEGPVMSSRWTPGSLLPTCAWENAARGERLVD